jgi:predicted ester cyclase
MSMDKARKNKDFIIRYYNAISGVRKTRELSAQYTNDEALIQHIEFFDGAFPCYEMLIDEITAEGNRVIVRARAKGKHRGDLNGIPPTNKEVVMPFVIGYEIENEMIVSHWLIADQMMLMEQLGLMKQPAEK